MHTAQGRWNDLLFVYRQAAPLSSSPPPVFLLCVCSCCRFSEINYIYTPLASHFCVFFPVLSPLLSHPSPSASLISRPLPPFISSTSLSYILVFPPFPLEVNPVI